jgi:hypothetical protein
VVLELNLVKFCVEFEFYHTFLSAAASLPKFWKFGFVAEIPPGNIYFEFPKLEVGKVQKRWIAKTSPTIQNQQKIRNFLQNFTLQAYFSQSHKNSENS